YVVRAFPTAPVSAPLRPPELRRALRPERFTLKTILKRLEKDDPWRDFWKSRQRLEPVIKVLSLAVGKPSRKWS
ncbi:MAG: hypothetical protein ACE5HB_07770, partial [Terriglobia bacterium]